MNENIFWLRSGKPIHSIKELADHMPRMSHQDFHHHTQQGRNDFCNWLADIFQEHDLAAKLKSCKSRQDFQTILYNHIIQKNTVRKEHLTADTGEEYDKVIVKTPKRETKPVIPSPDAKQAASTGIADLQRQATTTNRLTGSFREQIVQSPEKFIEFHNKDADEKDEIADRFDAIHQKFQESMHPEVPQEVQKRLESLQERYLELKKKVSEVRKEGKDPLIADFILRPVPSKIRYATVTHDPKDFESIDILLKDAEQEIADALAFKEPNAKAEVEALVKGES